MKVKKGKDLSKRIKEVRRLNQAVNAQYEACLSVTRAIAVNSVVFGYSRPKELIGLSAKDVTGKTVKFKDGSVVKIVGGGDDTLLIQWPSGSVSGFGNVNNIVDVFDIKE